MKIISAERLSGFREKIRDGLVLAVEERIDLGLETLPEFDLYIAFHNEKNANAKSFFTGSSYLINVNVLPLVFYKLSAPDHIMAKDLMSYFDHLRIFLKAPTEEAIFSFLENPQGEFDDFLNTFKNDDEFKAYESSLEITGNSFDEYKEYAFLNAPSISKIINQLMPVAEKTFQQLDLSVLRHELDHLAFFTSPLYKNYYRKRSKCLELEQSVKQDKSLSEEFAQTSLDSLKLMRDTLPAAEVRALFFNNIKRDNWKRVNYEVIKKRVNGHFRLKYLESYISESIAKLLVGTEDSGGEMDSHTTSYLQALMNSNRKSSLNETYKINLEKVNYHAADRIENEHRKWVNSFKNVADNIVEAVGNVYRDDPSRLDKTNYAEFLEDFFMYCEN